MLLDYVRQYGNDSFEQTKANALDLLVLAELSNFDYVQSSKGEPLAQAVEQAVLPTIRDAHHNTVVSLNNKEDLELAQLVKKSERYAAVYMHDFQARYVERSQQFGALAVQLNDVLCIAFRATDFTVTGWHESLELSRNEPTGSQLDAAAFLARNVASWPGRILVCGHSKGGNLAEYACRALVERDPAVLDRLISICSFDGPGLAPPLRKTEAYRQIAPLIRTFIPKSSIVGNIHKHPKQGLSYVDSPKPFVVQHYVYNWETNGTHLVAAQQTMIGRITSGLLNLLIAITSDTAKHQIFEVLFAPYRLLGHYLLQNVKDEA
ncbi:hypothetical protein D2E26_1305 [Bifidobacterium dolichotidis]|uniref:DUF2974 domain-containing protein n=1 Tax=Bifidobacterium dolichotidis TaxID=2306976 RepID=A0A430FNV3_9BIFI|nr:Mbeg1-like protein [Bifidobacterium dolichotidis]RSX54505.1 hypothetical protein D2E26_1305 [Bifidobacterium dolichotidis]